MSELEQNHGISLNINLQRNPNWKTTKGKKAYESQSTYVNQEDELNSLDWDRVNPSKASGERLGA